jgi:uncharacterized membrane protein required for colicin V production
MRLGYSNVMAHLIGTVTEAPIYRLNWVDGILLILLIRMGYVGFQTGLGSELNKLVGLTVGFCLGFRIYQSWGDAIAKNSFLSIEWASVVALVLIVMGGYLAMTRGLKLMGHWIEVKFHDPLSRMGGLLVGLFRAVLVSSVVWVTCQQLPSPYLHDSIEKHSISGPRVSRVAPGIYDGLMTLGDRLFNAW